MDIQRKHLPADERRAVTVEAVVKLAARQNPSEITTAAIATSMKLTQGALFRHFPNKDAIWQAVMEWVADHLGRQGLQVHAGQVLITTGSQQGLDLVGKVLIDAGSRVMVETPTYLGALQAFAPYEPVIDPVASDSEGPLPDAMDAAARRGEPVALGRPSPPGLLPRRAGNGLRLAHVDQRVEVTSHPGSRQTQLFADLSGGDGPGLQQQPHDGAAGLAVMGRSRGCGFGTGDGGREFHNTSVTQFREQV